MYFALEIKVLDPSRTAQQERFSAERKMVTCHDIPNLSLSRDINDEWMNFNILLKVVTCSTINHLALPLTWDTEV